jgi:hypothetical protein
MTPAAPGSLSATSSLYNQANISWAAAYVNNTTSTPVLDYKVERATNSSFSSGLTVLSTTATGTTYVDSSITSTTATTYYYRLSARNSLGYGTVSTTSVTTPAQIVTTLTNSMSASTFNLNTTSTATATLKASGVGISGKTIIFEGYQSAAWSTIATGTTNTSGVATYAWTPTESTWTAVRARFDDSGNYKNSTSSSTAVTIRTLQTKTAFTATSGTAGNLYTSNFESPVGSNVQFGTKFVMPTPSGSYSDLRIAGLEVYAKVNSGSPTVKGGVWTWNGSGVDGTPDTVLVGGTTAVAVTSTTYSWIDMPISSITATAGTAYAVGFLNTSSIIVQTYSVGGTSAGFAGEFANANGTIGALYHTDYDTSVYLYLRVTYTYWA